jgi:4-amino-4-deoxy-L-arabinose transferase-like glycosyltransferase
VVWAIWLALILAFIVLMWAVDQQFRDADSKLYSNIAQTLAAKPVAQWVAPEWSGFWNREGLFREHPPGVLWVSALLIRAGAPAPQAAAIANLFYYLLTFLFIYKLGRDLDGPSLGWAMVWASFLIPVTMQYLIRGNLEPPLTMATVMGMYAFVRADRSAPARAGFALALTAAVFFKGMQGLIVAIFAGIYWLFWSRDRRRFLTLASGIIFALLVCVLFEWRYRVHTGGEEFWLAYIGIQAGIAIKSLSVFSKLYNLVWYLGRILYFALPWSVLLLAARWWPRAETGNPVYPRAAVWRWLLVAAMVLVLLMAFFERKADRYVFPAYTLIAMAGGWYAWGRFARLRRRLDRPPRMMTLAFATSLLLAVILKTVAGRFLHQTIQIWRD